MRLLKTVHIDSEMAWGGGEVQVSALCDYLHDRGHGVCIMCRFGSRLGEWAGEQGLDVAHVRLGSLISLRSVLEMRSLLVQARPDVAHLHTARAHTLGSMAAKLASVRLVVATRRMEEPIKMVWPNTRAYGDWVHAIVAISGAVRDSLISAGVDPGRIRLIESGADVDRFAEARPDPGLRASLGVADGIPLVGAAATLDERKGIGYLLEAAASLAREGTPLHLVIAGDGPRRDELRAAADRLGVSASFLGFHRDMPRLLASLDVLAMPSLTEGLGIAALEGMAAGKPVVASAVGGLKESIVDGETGFLVPARDSAALGDAIGKLVSDPALARRLGSAGQARVREKYSLINMAKRNEALYLELLDR